HVVWVNVDGAIHAAERGENLGAKMLDPDAIAQTYLALIRQDRSTWSDEIAIRPWVERF
ncbi:MAG: oxidoreductase, partial [Pseudomonadota bacterium]